MKRFAITYLRIYQVIRKAKAPPSFNIRLGSRDVVA